MFVNTFWSLVPPIVAIGLALLTKETYSSLFIGIVVGALLATDFSPIGALDTIINDGLTAAIADNAGIFLFLVILGVMVALVTATGGSAAGGRWAASHIHSKAGALLATFALGGLIFIDDYFNCLTVGSVMTPVTDSQRISRVKLAYLIDATAAPICMIAPISSWAAAVSGGAAKLDTGVSGIQLFIEAIPYNFYSLLTIVIVITMVVLGVDYGPMAAAELKAAQTGDLGALSEEQEEGSSRANMWDMLIPIFLLIIFCVIGLIYVGGFWDPETNAGDFIAAFGDTDAFVGLPWGALIALVLSIIYLCARRVITFKGAMGCMTKGFNAMGLTCFEPRGAFYAFPCIKSTGMTSQEFCTRLLEQKHVALVPGDAFGASGEGYCRVSYAYSVEHLTEAMKRIRAFLEENGIAMPQ